MILKNIVPWGRSKDEYIKMFNLSESELKGPILGCGDGPSSFNSQCNNSVISVDPIYKFSKEYIKKRIDETCSIVCRALEREYDKYLWSEFSGVEQLKKIRLTTMDSFLEDYERGIKEGRYVPGSLPTLDFEDNKFNIALSSHLLFLYSDQLDFGFHKSSIKEMLRVAKAVKIFPLVDLNGDVSTHLEGIILWLKESGYYTELVSTKYEFQKGANRFLYIRR